MNDQQIVITAKDTLDMASTKIKQLAALVDAASAGYERGCYDGPHAARAMDAIREALVSVADELDGVSADLGA